MYVPSAASVEPRTAPIVTLSVVFLIMIVFGVIAGTTLILGPALPIRWFAALALTPESVRPHTLLTYWLLHDDLFHVSVNALLLFLACPSLEAALGWRRCALLVITGAAITGGLEAWTGAHDRIQEPGVLIIGASGVAASALGAYAALFHHDRLRIGTRPWVIPALPLIVALVIVEIANIGLRPYAAPGSGSAAAAHWAHIAGFLYGILFAAIAGRAFRRQRLRSQPPHQMVGGALADVERWEAVLRLVPTDADALIQLPLALARVGDGERAAEHAAIAVLDSMNRRSLPEAAQRYGRLIEEIPFIPLPLSDAMNLAGALAESGQSEEAAALFVRVAEGAEEELDRTIAGVKAAACLIRKLGRNAEGADRLETILPHIGDREWRAYAERLLREARTSVAHP
ncbi:MAG: rhomboid family intramembrane serine protease [Chthonomonadales bacterium]|nr:rhomboid family intramembrane serine protease [Chthonomonadales bacterium]